MHSPLKLFRDQYRETLLTFLWREWTALGVAGTEKVPVRHVSDPEALLLFTCTLGRYDQRLFDEVMDWLLLNGRFINIQRLRNILAKEEFRGGAVLSAVADWLATQGASKKWKLLAKQRDPVRQHIYRVREEPEAAINYQLSTINSLFFLPDSRPMPLSKENDSLFLRHGFQRNLLKPRSYSQPFAADAPAACLLKLRALFGVNARCEILNYLALNGIGHPREIARALYYSQKTVHDTLTDLACSGILHTSKGPRERVYRLSPGSLPFLDQASTALDWINWPMLLSTAEGIWYLTERLCAAGLHDKVLQSEITLTMGPITERLTRARWMPHVLRADDLAGVNALHAFHTAFSLLASR